VDADLASLLNASPSGSPRSLVVLAPLVEPERFLRLDLTGDPLFWDGSAWGEHAIAARGFAARWPLSLGAPDREIREALARHELLGAPDAGGPRCYGGFAFHDVPSRGGWAAFGRGALMLPRLGYERHGERAWLRLNLAADEALAGWLPMMHRVRCQLAEEAPTPPPRARIRDEAAAAYQGVVASAVAAIERGEFVKLVAARAMQVELQHPDPWATLAALCGPNLVRFALGQGPSIFLGATPERLLTLDDAGVRTEALAGSVAAGPGAEGWLMDSAKDRHEHEVVVETIVNTLRAHRCTVEAPATPAVRRLRHLLHLATPIRARPPSGASALALAAILHPTPAVCGLPQGPAAAWLHAHEQLERGWYAGPFGWFDALGRGTFAVALRSALIHERSALVFAGAGLVRGSTPDGELHETALKARSMLDALGVSP
jgi:salicylate biosynthesis isochorismate synthase